MIPTEQEAFLATISAALSAYMKPPTPNELAAWWHHCKGFSLHDVERALHAHEADEKDGKHAPRPIDVKRRLSTSSSNSERCAAIDVIGACRYPGIFSDSTNGEGPWYCPWHHKHRSGPEASRFIQASNDVPYEVAMQRRLARVAGSAQTAST